MKELHERSLCVLDMIETAKQRLTTYSERFKTAQYWRNTKELEYIPYARQITLAALDRLHIYHRNLLYKLLHSTK